jgi:hypothetical protein
MIITSAQYKNEIIEHKDGTTETQVLGIITVVDSEELFVPIDTGNRHYAEILKQVADGDITIAEAD